MHALILAFIQANAVCAVQDQVPGKEDAMHAPEHTKLQSSVTKPEVISACLVLKAKGVVVLMFCKLPLVSTLRSCIDAEWV